MPMMVLLSTTLGLEKQIKLEDIEKDNLNADQQTKLEKQYEQYKQTYQQQIYQHPAFQQQSSISYQPPVGQYQQLAQQSPLSYLMPYTNQYLQQALYQQGKGRNGLRANGTLNSTKVWRLLAI